MATKEVLGLKDSLKELQEINEWFDSQKEVDVEAGLEKIRRGAELLKASKARLGEIENEFIQIRGEMEG
jgi:hypothetical protein